MIHILTLTWNGLDKLQKLRPGLNESVVENAIWHIRENGSNDGTSKEVSAWEEVKLYDIGHNRANFAQGMNFLFKQAKPADDDLVLLLNNDVQFADKYSLSNMIRLKKETKSDIVGCRLFYTDSDILQHAGVIFSSKYGKMPWHFRAGKKNDKNAVKHRYFQAVTAAVCLISAKAWKEVGGMDQKFSWAFDDIDLNIRIGQLKKNNIVYCGETNIYHEESASLKRNNINKLFLPHNVKYFKQKWWKNNEPTYKLDHDLYLTNPNYRLV